MVKHYNFPWTNHVSIIRLLPACCVLNSSCERGSLECTELHGGMEEWSDVVDRKMTHQVAECQQ